MLRRTLIPLAIAAGLLIPATASARTYTTVDHGVRATLTPHGSLIKPEFPTLTVSDTATGTTLYQGSVTNPGCGTGCGPSTAPLDPPLRFAALDGPGSADLLVNLYSGGANCCTVLDVLRPSAAMGGDYVVSAHYNFTYAGYRLQRLGGELDFVSADPTFETTFTDFAGSGLPIQILHLQGVDFRNVTAHEPALIRADARRWYTAYRQADGHDDVGLIAAWAADEARLGHWKSARAYLVSQARAGRLRSALYPRSESGMRFVSSLEKLLRHEGYLK